MLMRNDQHDAFDALIDEAAHALTRQAPLPSLRANVRERIAQPWRPWSLVPTMAAAAVVLVAVIVGRDLFVAPDAPARVAFENAAADDARAHTQPTDALAGADTARPPQHRVQPSRRVSASIAPVTEEPPIPPLTIEPLAVSQILIVASSSAMPIEIAPLRIDPIPDASSELTNDSQRPGSGL